MSAENLYKARNDLGGTLLRINDIGNFGNSEIDKLTDSAYALADDALDELKEALEKARVLFPKMFDQDGVPVC